MRKSILMGEDQISFGKLFALFLLNLLVIHSSECTFETKLPNFKCAVSSSVAGCERWAVVGVSVRYP